MKPATTRTLVFSGELTVSTVAEHRARLLEALAEHSEVKLSFQDVAEVDIAFLQLLEAARVSARRDGNTIKLSRPAQDALLVALRRAGLAESFDQAAFWFPGPSFWLQGAEAA